MEGDNDHIKYFMINLCECCVAKLEFELAMNGSTVIYYSIDDQLFIFK